MWRFLRKQTPTADTVFVFLVVWLDLDVKIRKVTRFLDATITVV